MSKKVILTALLSGIITFGACSALGQFIDHTALKNKRKEAFDTVKKYFDLVLETLTADASWFKDGKLDVKLITQANLSVPFGQVFKHESDICKTLLIHTPYGWAACHFTGPDKNPELVIPGALGEMLGFVEGDTDDVNGFTTIFGTAPGHGGITAYLNEFAQQVITNNQAAFQPQP